MLDRAACRIASTRKLQLVAAHSRLGVACTDKAHTHILPRSNTYRAQQRSE
jgi:hypothetical protein